MSDIFLSYANEDRERARLLYSALADHGWSVFWDRAIPAGKTWRLFLEEQLESSRAMVVLWSVTSVMSPWVVEEAENARSLAKPLVPVLLDPIEPPIGLRATQAANLIGWAGDTNDPNLKLLLQDVENMIGRPSKVDIPKEPVIQPGNVFISYSREDNDYVQRLIAFLRNSGLPTWADDRIDYGDLWWRTIVANIRSCVAIVVVMTPNSEHSKWVEREVMFADSLQKPVFPLLLDGQGFPLLIGVQHHDVRDGRMPPSSFTIKLKELASAGFKTVPTKGLSKIRQITSQTEPERRPEESRLTRWLNTIFGVKPL